MITIPSRWLRLQGAADSQREEGGEAADGGGGDQEVRPRGEQLGDLAVRGRGGLSEPGTPPAGPGSVQDLLDDGAAAQDRQELPGGGAHQQDGAGDRGQRSEQAVLQQQRQLPAAADAEEEQQQLDVHRRQQCGGHLVLRLRLRVHQRQCQQLQHVPGQHEVSCSFVV